MHVPLTEVVAANPIAVEHYDARATAVEPGGVEIIPWFEDIGED